MPILLCFRNSEFEKKEGNLPLAKLVRGWGVSLESATENPAARFSGKQ
jgi:hypothetical protein